MSKSFVNWVKVDMKAPWRKAQQAAGREAVCYWLEGTCWASQNESDGELPASVFHESRLAHALLDAGLWEQTPTGYREVGYLTRHLSSAQREAKREAWRQRKNNEREKAHIQAPNSPVTLRQLGDPVPVEIEIEKEIEVERKGKAPTYPTTDQARKVLQQIAEFRKAH